MKPKLQAIRGMNDILPPASAAWQSFECAVEEVLHSYGYREIRMPLLEQTAVFERSIGDTTDIVQKEMYTFSDRNGESVSLRPEGTASCVRALLQHGSLQQQAQRLWYSGPMFRHERPQKGRYRQFHQVGAEVFGLAGPDIDAELILLTARLWRRLKITGLHLELNSLGAAAERRAYRAELRQYFAGHTALLDEDSRKRLEHNPIRILDSKNPALAEVIAAAPTLHGMLGEASRRHFDELRGLLDHAEIDYDFNPRLVRGLDYYSNTVFEWVTNELGAQGAVCAGGRYDGLVEILGGKPTPAIGFALGVERVLELQELQHGRVQKPAADVYLMVSSAAGFPAALRLAEQLREGLSGLSIVCHCGTGSLKSQMKKADRSGAVLGIICGDEELANGMVSVKPLRQDAHQFQAPVLDLIPNLQRFFPT